MSWDALGAIAELVGAVAIVLTLAYAAIQIKEAKKVALANTYQGRAEMRHASHLAALQNPQIAELLLRAGSEEGFDVEKVRELSTLDRMLLGDYVLQVLVYVSLTQLVRPSPSLACTFSTSHRSQMQARTKG